MTAPANLLPKEGLRPKTAVPVTLDISRLVSRSLHSSPTGIDRVELAYAEHVLAIDNRMVQFEAWFSSVGYRALPRNLAAEFVADTRRRWADGVAAGAAEWLRTLTKSSRAVATHRGHYIVPSHQNLDVQARVVSRSHSDSGLFVFLHDTIPADFPEYARPGGAERHLQRIRNTIAHADGIIVNSAATHDALKRYVGQGPCPPVLTAPLGVDLPATASGPSPFDRPYFLCLGTIEPRKNHFLLLHLWRQMAEQAPDPAKLPLLVLVGRRGWENENIVDLLDRSSLLKNVVIEKGRASDEELALLMTHAKALLMPSFAEGFGLPVTEALAAGIPVIASNLPALREAGGEAAEFLDPLDGLGWSQAIQDYLAPGSPRRAAQLQRIKQWQRPQWQAHFEAVFDFMDAAP